VVLLVAQETLVAQVTLVILVPAAVAVTLVPLVTAAVAVTLVPLVIQVTQGHLVLTVVLAVLVVQEAPEFPQTMVQTILLLTVK